MCAHRGRDEVASSDARHSLALFLLCRAAMRSSSHQSFLGTVARRMCALAVLALAAGAGCDGTDASSTGESVEIVRSAQTSGPAAINAGSATALTGWFKDQEFDSGVAIPNNPNNSTITISPEVVGAAPQSVYKVATPPRRAARTRSRIRCPVSRRARTTWCDCTLPSGRRPRSASGCSTSQSTARRSSRTSISSVAAAGQLRAVIKEFTVPADSNGQVVITFTRVTGQAIVNGIEVVTSTLAQATRIHAGGGALGPFAPDVGFTSSTAVTNTHQVATVGVVHASGPTLYQTGRTTTSTGSNFTYTVPGFAALSTNTVRLHFAETVKTAAGQRLFHVSINGTRVLDSFDIFAAAGGADRAIVREFRAAADASGKYAIKFEKLTSPVGAPFVSGIEVVRSVPWFVRSNMTSAQYQAEFTARLAAGYRLTYVNGYAGSGGTASSRSGIDAGPCLHGGARHAEGRLRERQRREDRGGLVAGAGERLREWDE